MNKKFLAMFTAVTLLFSMNSMTIFAETDQEITEIITSITENEAMLEQEESAPEVSEDILGITSKLNFLPLEGQITNDDLKNNLDLKIYKGYLPLWTEIPDALQPVLFAASLTRILPDLTGNYHLTKGIYSYYVQGEGFYSIIKAFVVDEDDVALGSKNITIETGRIGDNGYEPNPYRGVGEGNIPSTAKIASQDITTCLWSDEVYQYFTEEDLGSELFPVISKTTPFFTNERALHEFTSEEEMKDYLDTMQGGNMHAYSIGSSPYYSYDIPLVLFTKSDVPSDSLAEAAEIVKNNGKPTVWYQAQIHGNEPAGGEGALEMIHELQGAFGESILDSINVVMLPRINVEGSYIFARYNASSTDMNRDHLALASAEVKDVHDAYIQFLPEVAIDGHELIDFFAYEDHPLNPLPPYPKQNKMNNADDLEIDPATHLNNGTTVNTLGIELVNNIFDQSGDTGLRVSHYGTAVNSAIGRAYYGLYGSASVLVESRGSGSGSTAFSRRVYAHTVAIKSMMRTVADNSEEIKASIAQSRQDIIDKGRYYDEEDVIVLSQSKSGNKVWPQAISTTTYDMYGNVYPDQLLLELEDTIERGRTRPTAYAFSKGEAWVVEVLDNFDHQGIEYFELEPGSTVSLQQYYNSILNLDDNASLHAEKNVTFSDGVIIVPMDQVAGNIVAMLMEPDVDDSDDQGTFVRRGVISSNLLGDYPLYRFIQDDPRTVLSLTK